MPNFTEKAIIQTFQEMLEKSSFDKITVSAIVKKCGISSNTFYYHFDDIYDLLDTWLELNKNFLVTIPLKYKNWQDVLKELLLVMRKNSQIIYHLFNSLSRERMERYIFTSTDDTFYRIISRELREVNLSEEMLRGMATYFGYCILGFMMKFVWSRMELDIDRSVDEISDIMNSAIEGYVNFNKDK